MRFNLDNTKVLITNGDLEIVDPGIEYVIQTDKEVLDGLVFNLFHVFHSHH